MVSVSVSSGRSAASKRGGGQQSSSSSPSILTVVMAFSMGLMAGHVLELKDWRSYSNPASWNATRGGAALVSSLSMLASGPASSSSESTAAAAVTSTSTTSSTSDFVTRHAMPWKVPAHIATQRHDECLNSKISKTGGFCLTKSKFAGGNQMFDRPLADFLAHHVFKDQTVVDLGAGLGHYGKIFQEPNSPVKAWVGYDGAINVEEVTEGLVRFMDLTQPHATDERSCVQADWAMSLEVAEHIPVVHTDAYLRNIRCHARVGAVISWGLPEQTGGLGHVNCRTEADAVAAVEKWGFKADWDLTKQLREVATLNHFKKTPVVYRVV